MNVVLPKEQYDALLLERANLAQQIKWYQAQALPDEGKIREHCSVLIGELERWRQQSTQFMTDTEERLRQRIHRQRRELRRLNRDLLLLRTHKIRLDQLLRMPPKGVK